jgi:muramoyltetrapeptide carboxypeptidase
LDETISRVLEDFDGPIAMGLRSGHVSRQNVTLTLGVQAEMNLGVEARLHLLEAALEMQGPEARH